MRRLLDHLFLQAMFWGMFFGGMAIHASLK
jgi:hypothetical protein